MCIDRRGEVTLNADEDKLRRVLDDLVKNVVQAIDHGRVRVAAL